uniref:Ankyrin repeat protein n=1 Tax=Pithovirus LCPAC101 TaxID=2506586 RepID=A0A481Z2P1_9VIRU|nr:MAG: ankyrin repeat protein [Pithovirus LCPAC101]
MESIPSELFFDCDTLDTKDLKSLCCVDNFFSEHDNNINWTTYIRKRYSDYIKKIDDIKITHYLKNAKYLSCTLDCMKLNGGTNILNYELLKMAECDSDFSNNDLLIYNLFIIICDRGYEDLAKEFILHNESSKLFYNFESLNRATKNNYFNIVKLIIDSKPCNLYIGNKLLQNLSLYHSFVNNNYDIFKLLFENNINNEVGCFMFIQENGKYGPIYGGDGLSCLMLYFHLCTDVRLLELVFNPKFEKYWNYNDYQINGAIKDSEVSNNKMVLDFLESKKELIAKNMKHNAINFY